MESAAISFLGRSMAATMRSSSSWLGLIGTLSLAGAMACDFPTRIPPTEVHTPNAAALQVGSGDGIPRFREPLDSIRELAIPAEVHSFHDDLSDEELITAVRRSEGIVGIGLKTPTAERTEFSRVLPAMNKGMIVAAHAVLRSRGVEITGTFRHIAAVSARIDPDSAPTIRALPIVNYLSAPGVGSLAQSYPPQDTSWGVHKIGVDSVWQIHSNTGGLSAVTILDYGVFQSHVMDPQLDGPDLTRCTYHVDATNTCYNGVNHGAMVAGIVKGRNNSTGYIGAAYGLGVFNSVRVSTSAGITTALIVAESLDWAVMWGYPRHTVNMSLVFCQDSPVLAAAVASASNAGLLLVAAAGNTTNACPSGDPPGSTGVMFPARYPQVIAVSGTLPDDSFAVPDAAVCLNPPYTLTYGGSRYGTQVELSAPFHWFSMYYYNGWGSDCGTSLAAPAVAAVAAMVWTANPSWTAALVKSRLFQTAVDRGAPGLDSYFGYGRVDAMRAVTSSLLVTISGTSTIKLAGNYSWTASASGGSGSYTYTWEESIDGGPYSVVGSGPTYGRYVDASTGTSIDYRVTARAGIQVGSSTKHVAVIIP